MLQEILAKLPRSVTDGVDVRVLDHYPDKRSAEGQILGRYRHSLKRVEVFLPGLPGIEWLEYVVAHEFGHRNDKLRGETAEGFQKEINAHRWALQFVTLPG